MTTKKNSKGYSKKKVQLVLDNYTEEAAKLYNNSVQLEKQLNQLEAYIQEHMTVINDFADVKKWISIIRDVSSTKDEIISLFCIVSIISAILYLNCLYELEGKESYIEEAVNPKTLVIYINKQFKDDLKEFDIWEKWKKPGIFPIIPSCILDKEEEKLLEQLTIKYNKLMEPSQTAKVAEKIKVMIPQNITDAVEKATDSITKQDLYKKIMEKVSDGFEILVKNASKVTLSEEYILKQINSTFEDNHIFELDEICFARSYDISKLVNNFKTQNVFVAFAEGGATGLAGLPGIFANIATSLFIYYRAVQSVAMYYGYDVKNSADELEIATSVFISAISTGDHASSQLEDTIIKFMTISELKTVKTTVSSGWRAMADQGGLCLLLTQIRALAHKSARNALDAAGKKGLELTMFNDLLNNMGKKMTQGSLKKIATPLGAIITALVDVSTMNRILGFADIFYNKRFVTEKQIRIEMITNPKYVEDVEYDVFEE